MLCFDSQASQYYHQLTGHYEQNAKSSLFDYILVDIISTIDHFWTLICTLGCNASKNRNFAFFIFNS